MASKSAVTRVSRFEGTFEQIRKKDQLKHKPASILAISNFGSSAKENDLIKSANEEVGNKPASVSSRATSWSSLFHNPSSSGTTSNASIEAAAVEEISHQGPTRKNEILRMPSWRSTDRTPQENGCQSIFIFDRVSSPEQTASTRAELIAATVKARQAAIEMQYGPGTLSSFHPSHRALRRQGVLPDYDISPTSTSSTRSPSPVAYRGDPTVERNRSANIPEGENCALWIWCLPAHVTYKELLSSIRGVGKIYAAVINPPTGAIITSAAKVVFFQRFQAERLFDAIEAGRFVVMGKVIKRVAWNKIKSGAYPHLGHSRAIRITGPQDLMDFDFFENFFLRKFAYDLDRRGVVFCNRPGLISHEWHFASLRCQAASAKTAIERELKGIFEVEWAVDPCECL